MQQILLKKALPHLVAIGVFLVLNVIYFYPQVDGKVLRQGDITQFQGMSKEVKDYEAETGRKMYWTNGMFGGMPSYQITTVRTGNNLSFLDKIGRLFIDRPIGRFFMAMLSFYLMMVILGVSPWISAIGAIAFGLTTNNLVLYEAGHTSKLKAIFYMPYMVGGVILAFRKRYLLGGLLFGIGLAMSLWSNHVQMTYYFFMTLGVFAMVQLIDSILKKEWTVLGKAVGVLAIGGLLAVGSSASNLMPTQEMAEDTMRGAPILEPEAEQDEASLTSSQTEGLAWSYASRWSNSTIDLFATYIPGAAGGSSREQARFGENTIRFLRNTRNMQLPQVPLYWGGLGSTSGPPYMGAVLLFLFLASCIWVKGSVKWWLALGTLLTYLVSMGSYFNTLNYFLFENLPLFNKFRAHSSILSITPLLMATLGMIGLHQITTGKVDEKRAMLGVYISGGILLSIGLFFWLLGPTQFELTNEQELSQYGDELVEVFKEDRAAMMSNDALRSLFLVLIAAGLFWGHLKYKLDQRYLIVGLGLLVLFDFWGIDRRYLNEDNFEPVRNAREPFPARQVDLQIMEMENVSKKPPQEQFQNRYRYRVFDQTIDVFNSAQTSYYHNTVGGYNAAKLQRFDDLIQRHISKGSRPVLNMLNTKYIIYGRQGQPEQFQVNPGALGNGWIVDSLIQVGSPNQEIDALTNLNTAQVAVVHEPEFGELVQGFKTGGRGTVELTSYVPDHLTYQITHNQGGLAVFSEIWYGPGKGWNAYIDGEPVDHLRVNYALRGLMVPAGEHKVEFKFEPKSVKTGGLISFITSGLLLLGVLGMIYFDGRNALKDLPEEKPVAPVKAKSKAKARVGNKKKGSNKGKGKKG